MSGILVQRDRAAVAAFAADPDNATAWYANITAAQRLDEGRLGPGIRVSFVARFLGRTLAYTYEIVEYVPNERLVMRTQQGPFPMETTYAWRDAPGGGTLMTIRNRGVPRGFWLVITPILAHAMRRAMAKDLRRLKRILESQL